MVIGHLLLPIKSLHIPITTPCDGLFYIWVVIELNTITYLTPKGYLSKNLQNL